MVKKPRITIIELHYHAEVLTVLLELLDYNKFDVQLFTTKKIREQLESIPEAVSVYSTGKMSRKWLQKHRAFIEESDCVYINTLAGYYDFIRSLPAHIPTIVRVHNVNTFFRKDSTFKPIYTPFQLWKDFSYWVRKVLFYNELSQIRKTLPQIDYFIFPSGPMAARAKKLSSLQDEKFINTPFPITYSEEIPYQEASPHFTIAIPGGVDPRKKDLELVVEAFRELEMNYDISLSDMRLTFLGQIQKGAGMKMIRRFEPLQELGLQVEYFKGFIPFDVFDRKFAEADVVLAPILETTRFHIFEEEYGYTKVTGAMNDAIRFSKPILLPDFYPRSKETEPMTYYFDSAAELADLLFSLKVKKNNQKLSCKPIFTKEKLSYKMNALLSSLTRDE